MRKLMVFIALTSLGFASCKSNKDLNQAEEQVQSRSNKEGRKGSKEKPNPAEILSQFDINKDGRLAQSEVKGPLADDFDKIDTNNDGFLSLEELKNAPKPQRRQRGGRG